MSGVDLQTLSLNSDVGGCGKCGELILFAERIICHRFSIHWLQYGVAKCLCSVDIYRFVCHDSRWQTTQLYWIFERSSAKASAHLWHPWYPSRWSLWTSSPLVLVSWRPVTSLMALLNIWILLYVAFYTIMTISRQKEARSRDYALLLFQMTSRVLSSAQYHRQHCKLHPFEQFGALYMHNHDDKYPSRTGFESGTTRLQAQPIRMSHRGRPWPYWPLHILG